MPTEVIVVISKRGPFVKTGFPLGFKEYVISLTVEVNFLCIHYVLYSYFNSYPYPSSRVKCYRLQQAITDLRKQSKWTFRNIR